MKGNPFVLSLFTVALAVCLSSCSNRSAATNDNDISSSLSSLSQLPSADGMLTGTGANSISKSYNTERMDQKFLSSISLQTVSGTPPVLKDITAATADTYFW